MSGKVSCDVVKGLESQKLGFVTSSGHAWLYKSAIMGTHVGHRWHAAEMATVTVSDI